MILYRNKMLSISHTEELSENCDYDFVYFRFIYALKAPETKRQYPKRLEVFLDHLKLQGNTIEEKANEFYKFALNNPRAFQNRLLNYIEFQKTRAKSGQISLILS
jgi:hypothetical protein